MAYVKHMGILSHVYADMEIDYANAVTLMQMYTTRKVTPRTVDQRRSSSGL